MSKFHLLIDSPIIFIVNSARPPRPDHTTEDILVQVLHTVDSQVTKCSFSRHDRS